MKKIIFLDIDGVICLSSNWGGRSKKRRKWMREKGIPEYQKDSFNESLLPVYTRFDNFDKKALKILNDILEKTDAEIVVSSDWRHSATLEELGEYYLSQGILKKPIGYTTSSLPSSLPFFRRDDEPEETRSYEILEWLKEHPEVTHWVAIDDLDMSERYSPITSNYKWGLKNFVHTPKSSEGIKQLGIKKKILNFLTP